MKKILTIFIVIATLSAGCQAQTREQQIINTSKEIIAIIKNGRPKELQQKMYPHLSGKNEEIIESQHEYLKYLFDSVLLGKEPQIVITDEVDELGRLKVIIPIFKGADKKNNLAEARLELFFGPTYIVPLDIITTYEVITVRLEEPRPPPVPRITPIQL